MRAEFEQMKAGQAEQAAEAAPKTRKKTAKKAE